MPVMVDQPCRLPPEIVAALTEIAGEENV